MAFADEDTPWRRCEVAWMAFLAGADHMVTRLADLVGNARGTRAPMMQFGERLLRAPDIEAAKSGISTLWEVKYRKRPEINRDTGEPEYWMSNDSFHDYHEIASVTGKTLNVVLLDRSAWDEDRRWRCATIQTIAKSGRKEVRFGARGIPLEAWIWPASCMEIIVGPDVDLPSPDPTVFPAEGNEEEDPPVEYPELVPIERVLRSGEDQPDATPLADPRAAQLIRAIEPAQHALEVLRLSLGIPEYPNYSVLRIGLDGVDLDDLLTLPRYGIRLFLVTEDRPASTLDQEELLAFEEARLLEWAVVDGIALAPRWIVDGRDFEGDDDARAALEAGEEAGGINRAQYEIIHTPADQDIIVTAGAGTGKTETMSERILYLLATSPSRGPLPGRAEVALRLDDIALITFSKESAAEMRKRIARTLMIRQRLCRRSVLPTVAWLLQLGTTDIDTIHAYAKKIVQRDGAILSISPNFRVSQQTLDFRRLVRDALSPLLSELFTDFPDDAPAAHEFDAFLEELWGRLTGNGLSPLALPGAADREPIAWGSEAGLNGVTRRINDGLRTAMTDVASRFSELCVESQALPVDELVSVAKRAVDAARGSLRRRPAYLFIDEFQDTDQEQMALILALRMSLDARLYAVGDPKQGVFRFRGAQGSALAELKARAAELGLSPRDPTLTRNYRSDGVLLDALHDWFSRWGDRTPPRRPTLDYGDGDRLQPAASVRGRGMAPLVQPSPRRLPGPRSVRDLTAAVEAVKEWWEEGGRQSIAVLCRWNSQAQRVRDRLRNDGVPCEVLVGGDFFRTPAVRETAVLLRAALHPEDDATLLQLAESRWFPGLQALGAPPWLDDETRADWAAQPIPALAPWYQRVASLDRAGYFSREDLEPLRTRLSGLSRGLETMPTISWLLHCRERMSPDLTLLNGETDDGEVRRYGRCFDHLLALLDATFGDAAVSPHQALDWVTLQTATNTSEDEPLPSFDVAGPTVIAMTVHKAKGLEFDRVLIPFCDTPFGAPSNASAVTSVVSDDGTPTLLWSWNGLDNASDRLWDLEDAEVEREETRLLYVAMTRARHELVIFTEGGTRGQNQTWDDLLT